MRRDDNLMEKRYSDWKKKNGKRIPGISKENSDFLLEYISDMECGLNFGKSSKKGGRSPNRLYNLQQRMAFLTKLLEKYYNITDLRKVEERHLHEFFTRIRNGDIKRDDGKVYQDPANFVKIFKAFWHWHQKVNRKKGIELYDLTQDLDTSKVKPKWVYLTEEEIRLMYDSAILYYKALIMFLFDTGIRAPSELRNIRVSDFQNNFKDINTKTALIEFFKKNLKKGSGDYRSFNKKLKIISKRLAEI